MPARKAARPSSFNSSRTRIGGLLGAHGWVQHGTPRPARSMMRR
jgi:hypothetical protein